MITEHAKLAPSSAPQWGRCSGSVAANLNAPDVVSERMRGGTASHWVGEQALTVGGDCYSYIGKTAPNGVVIDEEMAEGAQAWVDDVQSVTREYCRPGDLRVEYRVSMPEVHADNWGTLDTALWVGELNTLFIWDYKFGHREVNARENLQLINYAIGMLSELRTHTNPDTRIVLRVVQPFCYHALESVSEWALTRAEIAPYIQTLIDKAYEALGPAPLMTAGLHCRDCAAIARCDTAKRMGYSVITYANEPYTISVMGGADLAAEYRILAEGLTVVKARLEAVSDEIKNGILNKQDTSSGLTIQSKQGRLAWSIPVPQAIALASQFGADVSKPGVMTPTQAIKAVPKGVRSVFEGVLKTATERPSTGMKLIPAENSRTARAFRSK